jgi:CheY-like chemotaxis protein
MKVLIADDDVDVADSLAVLVRVVLDFDVCVMYDGEGAIANAGDYRPDAVVLDIDMPGLDGFQTAHRLKMDRRLEHKPFIAHTAATDPLTQRIARRVGFECVIEKGNPESVSTLIDLLARLSKVRSSARGDRSQHIED